MTTFIIHLGFGVDSEWRSDTMEVSKEEFSMSNIINKLKERYPGSEIDGVKLNHFHIKGGTEESICHTCCIIRRIKNMEPNIDGHMQSSENKNICKICVNKIKEKLT